MSETHRHAGPWENRTAAVRLARAAGAVSYPIEAAWLNATFSVQLLRHDTHPGIDHLLVRRHDDGTDIGWADLQAIKDRLLDDGQARWAYEAFPPKLEVIDNQNLRHLWVMPVGWQPPITLAEAPC